MRTPTVSVLLFTVVILFACGGDDSRPTDSSIGIDGPSDTGASDSTAGDTTTGDTGGADGGCGPNTCGLCEPACAPLDQCVDGSWVCDCICEGPAPGCSTEQDAVRAFIESNKTCTDDADCQQVAASCFDAQEDCCVVYMRGDFDMATWGPLLLDLEACEGAACGCCDGIPADPGCNAGRCGPRMP
jgi:hypothetical protein